MTVDERKRRSEMKLMGMRLAFEDKVWQAVSEWGGQWEELPLDIALGAIADLMIYIEEEYDHGLDMTLREVGVGLEILDADGEWK